MSYLLSRRQLTLQFRGRAVHSRLFDRNPFIRAHQRQGVEVGPGRQWHVNGQTEAQGTLCGEWFDIHGIILVATQIHQVAVPVAHDNDNDMSAPDHFMGAKAPIAGPGSFWLNSFQSSAHSVLVPLSPSFVSTYWQRARIRGSNHCLYSAAISPPSSLAHSRLLGISDSPRGEGEPF